MRRRLRYYWDTTVLLGVPLGTLLVVLYWFGCFHSTIELVEGMR
jgi:hypothetical protein